VIQRAKQQAVTMTCVTAEVIYQDGKFTKVDRTVALKALHDDLAKALSDDRGRAAETLPRAVAACPRFYAII